MMPMASTALYAASFVFSYFSGLRQLDFIFTSKEAKANLWFYFDIYHSDWRFLDGTKRQYK
jgi:hypothetical protein